MGTKLDSLVNALRILGYENTIINLLIIDYFSDQNAKEFDTEEATFVVLSVIEMKDLRYDMADTIFDDQLYDLECLAERKSWKLNLLIKAIDRETAVQYISDDLDFEDENDYQLIDSTDHLVYLKN